MLTIFAGLMLGMLLGTLDQTVVAPALPTIVEDLGGLDHLSWVVTAYLLATTISTPIQGKLGDLYGRRRVFQVAIVIFVAGSLLSGLATSMLTLIIFRAVQGVGAGGLIVVGQGIIADIVSPRERGRYQALFGAFFGVASVAGPLVGGVVTDHLSWRWIFYLNLPLGLVALAVTSAVLPLSPRRRHARVDCPGAALLAVIIGCVVLAATWTGGQFAWDSPVIAGLLIGAALLGVVFVAVERRTDDPLLPLHLFRNRTFAVSTGIALALGMAMFTTISFLPLFLQTVNGVSATSSGLLLIPLMVGLLSASVVAGFVVSRTGRYRGFPIAGTTITTAGVALLATLDATSSRWQSGLSMAIVGVGIGLTMQIIILASQNEVPPADLGVASATVTLSRAIGGSVGVALFGAIFNARLTHLPSPTDVPRSEYLTDFADAFTGTFWYAVPVLIVAVALAVALHEQPLRSTVHPALPDNTTAFEATFTRRAGATVSSARAPASFTSEREALPHHRRHE